ncbi:MAG: glutamate synthase subunit beta [Gammaproteobacteria bacterium]|nr:glutamate synthase subunit beta [Gammaproteobacteria bacterium]MDE0280025.1 glutamate synthase subunit beta [Gammaproteobacteria bacterium]MDE0716163.1 glutamate synthase subunit beta [Gammaproteobacteria bacterium]MXY65888.1 glutamate synthase subunit beta [Gammaproteobacteria bacterium]MYG66428.1 glutamate synthase subunit beta [Gammaproteobacteria bacterium]
MGKPTGFMEIPRKERRYKPVHQRVRNYREFVIDLSNTELRDQGARCMDCGIPYCHQGCPVNNLIPDWNDLVYRDDWKAANERLHATNNFPEFTGRVCPAPCEESCTLNIEDVPVTIKTIEYSIVERAFQEGWIQPRIPRHRSGKRVAVVGSGPAGLASAQQLARSGHGVSIYEKQDRSGGLLRYGIPDFKLEKSVIDRRMAQMKAEGVRFHSNTHIGKDLPVSYLVDNFDAVVLAGGCEVPRDLPVPGRDLDGIHFAMDFLRSNSRRVQGGADPDEPFISAADRNVVVIGGGDTGSDCIGTSNRHGAASITQIEILSKPPEREDKALTWPNWPHKLRTSSSHQEGCDRLWDVVTKSFVDDGNGQVTAVRCIKVAWKMVDGRWKMEEIPGSEFELKAELVALAMGFIHPVFEGMLEDFGLALDGRGNVSAAEDGNKAYQTSVEGVFVAGDMRRGQSLVVWAIREGRQCAEAVNRFLRAEGGN